MAFEFLFAGEEETDWRTLQQGDVLQRTERLADCLREAHSYYADASDYTHFMILTQSCDLVRRHGKSVPNARYITIAAIRPVTALTQRLFEKYRFGTLNFPLIICDKAREPIATNQIERLIHNTEGEHFFLPKDSHPSINFNYCVFLRLSVALKASHYDALLAAKVAQLDNVFQAKVGWMKGNIYSRVGTPDLEEFEADPEATKKDIYEDLLYQETAWLTSDQFKWLKSLIRDWQNSYPDSEMSREDALGLIQRIPEDVDMLAERAAEQLKERKLLSDDPGSQERAANLLKNDRVIRRLLGGS